MSYIFSYMNMISYDGYIRWIPLGYIKVWVTFVNSEIKFVSSQNKVRLFS